MPMWLYRKVGLRSALAGPAADYTARLGNNIFDVLTLIIVMGSSLDFLLPRRPVAPDAWQNLTFLFTWLVVWRFGDVLGPRPRIIALLALISIAGINDFIVMQTFSGGFFLLPVAVLITSLFFPRRSAIILVLAYLLILTAIATGFASRVVDTPAMAPAMARDPTAWLHLYFGMTGLLFFSPTPLPTIKPKLRFGPTSFYPITLRSRQRTGISPRAWRKSID